MAALERGRVEGGCRCSASKERFRGNERKELLDQLVEATLDSIDTAIQSESPSTNEGGESSEEEDAASLEAPEEPGEEGPTRDPSEKLLDRLLYKAVLPRYAFPTDVAAFHVFDQERSTRFRAAYRYNPVPRTCYCALSVRARERGLD